MGDSNHGNHNSGPGHTRPHTGININAEREKKQLQKELDAAKRLLNEARKRGKKDQDMAEYQRRQREAAQRYAEFERRQRQAAERSEREAAARNARNLEDQKRKLEDEKRRSVGRQSANSRGERLDHQFALGHLQRIRNEKRYS